MAVSNSLLGIYLKQISHVCDQVADFVNFYGFKETADSLEKSDKNTSVQLSCNVTQELTETFNEYGYVTLGITWIPGKYYSLIQKNGDTFTTVYSSKCVTIFLNQTI